MLDFLWLFVILLLLLLVPLAKIWLFHLLRRPLPPAPQPPSAASASSEQHGGSLAFRRRLALHRARVWLSDRLLSLVPPQRRMIGLAARPARTPLFAVLVYRDHFMRDETGMYIAHTAGRDERADRRGTLLLPYGIARPLVIAALVVGMALGLAVADDRWHMEYQILTVISSCLVALVAAAAPAYLVCLYPARAPLDDILHRAARSERPILMEAAGRLSHPPQEHSHPHEARVPPRGALRDCRQWLSAALQGIRPVTRREARMRAMALLHRANLQHLLLALALGRVLVGRESEQRALLRGGATANLRFVMLFYGHMIALYALIIFVCFVVVALGGGEAEGGMGIVGHLHPLRGEVTEGALFAAQARSPERASPLHVVALALFFWWLLLGWYSYSSVAPDLQNLREDLDATANLLPSSVDRGTLDDALGPLLAQAGGNWVANVVSASSVILLIAALTLMQVLGQS
ncbi:hypothetical protein [Sediminicoccus sp. BL-A-41-H5]|uniref:hypothetical protein n=1 Tax=Sediminicoccus sp. BL-A-41-H5 TaxID=3421106 RepID=UPI003D6796D3